MPATPALSEQHMESRAPNQATGKHYIVFSNFDTMDTQSDRVALDPRRPAWLENLQPIGPNELRTVPAPAAALTSIVGKTINKEFYANYGGNDYEIAFTSSGALYQINLSTGVQTLIAADGTFTDPDVTQWKSERILIADSQGGYCTWDGTVFVKSGGVSPQIVVTNGGTGYGAPTTTITGGSGAGATATPTIVGGVITAITLTNAGTGYKAGDVLTVNIIGGGGAGATATARVWPIMTFSVTTLAVFQGRVWLAGARTLQWTGTAGYDDDNPANAAGSAVLSDADLVRSITALRNLNNYLYIFGDNSIKQIGTITVSGSATLFTVTTLSSDQGTTFPQSIVSYNRLVVFANNNGVYAVFGSSVEKISDPMDGIYANLDFTQKPVACPVDLRNIRVFMLLVKYNDPTIGARSIFLCFQSKKWYVISQGSTIRAVMSAPIGGQLRVYASSGPDVTRILADATQAVQILFRSSLYHDGKPMLGKRATRIGIAQITDSQGSITLTTDSESRSVSQVYMPGVPIVWVNFVGGVVQFVNSLSQPVSWVTGGFVFTDAQAYASGIYLGVSLSGTVIDWHLNGVVIEYVNAALMRSLNSG